jgi:hypothetical protein
MARIYNYISQNDILNLDNYNDNSIKIHKCENIKFRVGKNSKTIDIPWAITPLAVKDSKAINISTHHLSFLVEKYNHFVSHDLAERLQNTFTSLLQINDFEIISEPVFLFFGYVLSSGHLYDDLMYLIYVYKKNNMNCKVLALKSDSIEYNNLLKLLKDNFNIDYYYIDFEKNYVINILYLTKMYQNVFFNEVKEFININLIDPILKKYDSHPFYKNIYRIKSININNLNNSSNCYTLTEKFTIFSRDNHCFNLDKIDEEYKIYLLNKATNIIISWGSIYYIYINYYLKDSTDKKIVLLSTVSDPSNFFNSSHDENTHYQNMNNHDSGYKNQIYNNFKFNGKIFINCNSLDYLVDNNLLCI